MKYTQAISCMQRLHKRPISPHVFEIDGKSMHYKMPINAISSITNRATGVALTTGERCNRQLAATTLQSVACMSACVPEQRHAICAGIGAAGAIALVGDLPAAVDAFTASYPSLVYPAKAVITWPLFYHYLGGVRHIIWDKHSMGKQAEKKSYLENEAVNKSSKFIFATSIVGTLGLTILQF